MKIIAWAAFVTLLWAVACYGEPIATRVEGVSPVDSRTSILNGLFVHDPDIGSQILSGTLKVTNWQSIWEGQTFDVVGEYVSPIDWYLEGSVMATNSVDDLTRHLDIKYNSDWWMVGDGDSQIGSSNDLRFFPNIQPGDANADYAFSTEDFVQVFQSGKYEEPVLATWAEGDWNADELFNSSDLITAMRTGSYEESAPSVFAVPEPSALVLLLIASVLFRIVEQRKF